VVANEDRDMDNSHGNNPDGNASWTISLTGFLHEDLEMSELLHHVVVSSPCIASVMTKRTKRRLALSLSLLARNNTSRQG
jgi:hypothetical protein